MRHKQPRERSFKYKKLKCNTIEPEVVLNQTQRGGMSLQTCYLESRRNIIEKWRKENMGISFIVQMTRIASFGGSRVAEITMTDDIQSVMSKLSNVLHTQF
jgi:hypothetical protein